MNSPTHNVTVLACITVAAVAGALGLAVGAGGRKRLQARSAPARPTENAVRPMIRVELNRAPRIPRQATADRRTPNKR